LSSPVISRIDSHAPSFAFFVDVDPLGPAHVSEKLAPHSPKSVTACQLAVNHSKYGISKIYSPFFGQERSSVNFSNRLLTRLGPSDPKYQQPDKDIYYLSVAMKAFLSLKMAMVFLWNCWKNRQDLSPEILVA
jgi:hypothetical protein